MADYQQILNLASSQDWVALGINAFLSTIVGGIVIVILLAIVARMSRESINFQNAFTMVLLINVINLFGILGLLAGTLSSIALFLPVIVWLVFTKLFFSGLSWRNVLIVGVVGYALSIFAIPMLVASASSLLPF